MKYRIYLVSTDHHMKVVSADIIDDSFQLAIVFSTNYERHLKNIDGSFAIRSYTVYSFLQIIWLLITGQVSKLYLPDHVKNFYIFTLFFQYCLIEDGLKNRFPAQHSGYFRKLYFSRSNGNNRNCKSFLGTQPMFVPQKLIQKCKILKIRNKSEHLHEGVLIVLQPLFEDGHLSQEAAISCYKELQRQVLKRFNQKALRFFLRSHPRSAPEFVELLTHQLQGNVSIDDSKLYRNAATLFSSFIFEYNAEWIYFSGTSLNKQLLEIFGYIPVIENNDHRIF